MKTIYIPKAKTALLQQALLESTIASATDAFNRTRAGNVRTTIQNGKAILTAASEAPIKISVERPITTVLEDWPVEITIHIPGRGDIAGKPIGETTSHFQLGRDTTSGQWYPKKWMA